MPICATTGHLPSIRPFPAFAQAGHAGPAPASGRGDSHRLACEIEGNEREAYRSLFEVGAELFGSATFAVHEVEGATAFVCPAMRRPGVFNRVLGLGLERPLDTTLLGELAERFRRFGRVPSFELLPALLDAEASMTLRAGHVRRAATGVVLHRPRADAAEAASTAATARPGVQVQRVSGPGCRAVATLCVEVFDVPTPVLDVLEALQDQPGWGHWLALVDGQPAGAALTYMHEGRAWFGWACTLPAWRGRGIKGALDDARIEAADQAGCRWISTDTGTGTPLAPDRSLLSLMRRGFSVAHLRASYLPGRAPAGMQQQAG